MAAAAAPSMSAADVTRNADLELIRSIPEMAALGAVWKSCASVELTESETEYVVCCVKHIFARHIAFQFNVTNQLEGATLDAVQVDMEADRRDWSEEFVIPEEATLRHNQRGVTFVCFNRPENTFSSGAISCTLKFNLKDANSPKGNDDEYQLEEVEVVESDFMRGESGVSLAEFKRAWEAAGDSEEVVKKYSLGVDTLSAAVNAVIDLLAMSPVENSNIVPEDARSHGVNLIGTYFGDHRALCRAGFMLDPKHGVTLKIAVRSKNAAVRQMLVNCIH